MIYVSFQQPRALTWYVVHISCYFLNYSLNEPFHLHFCLCVCLFAHLFVCLSPVLPVCLSACPCVCLCLSVCPAAYLPLCMSILSTRPRWHVSLVAFIHPSIHPLKSIRAATFVYTNLSNSFSALLLSLSLALTLLMCFSAYVRSPCSGSWEDFVTEPASKELLGRVRWPPNNSSFPTARFPSLSRTYYSGFGTLTSPSVPTI